MNLIQRCEYVRIVGTKKGKCNVCFKRMSRNKTFAHPVGLFNVNADGLPKSFREVHRDVVAERDVWLRLVETMTHDKCAERDDD